MGNFTAVDIIVAVVMLGLAAFSFFRGFVHQVLAIGAWIGAVAGTFYGFPMARPFFRSHIDSALGADLATGISLFLVLLLVLSIATKAISDRVRRSALNSVDSSLGFMFGLGLGAALVSLAFLLISMLTGPDLPDWLAEAKTRPWLERGAAVIRSMAPDNFGDAEQKTKEVKSEARQLMEAEQQFREIVSPRPAATPTEDKTGQTRPGEAPARPATGYDRESRSQMDRLFQTTN